MLHLRLFARLLCLAVLFGPGLWVSAQSTSPVALSVTVTDPTKAVIAGAELTVSSAPGASTLSRTDEQGVVHLPLTPGTVYTLTVHAGGFGDVTATVTGGAAALTVQLPVLQATDQVNVQAADGASIDPEQTQSGLTLGQVQVADIPLNGRSLTDLLAIAPGVVPVSSAQPNAVVMSGVASTPPSGDLDIGALSVSGQRETANAFYVNHSDVQEDVNMGIAIVPTLDSVAELQVLTDSFEAKLGNQSGGQILVTTRSGGSQLHGSLYDYFRNTDLDARSYFSIARAPFHQNQFGATVGGPTPFAGLHFFADYQGTRQTQGIDTGLIAVPSQADRTGDLSDTASSLNGRVSGTGWAQVLSQRLGYAVSQGEPYYRPGCTTNQVSSAAGSGCVFPGGQIPTSAWSAPAGHLLQYIPQPNLSTNTFATSAYAQTLRDDKGSLRLDRSTRAGDLTLYGFTDDYSLDNPYPSGQGGATVPGFSARNNGRAQLYASNLTTTFGTALVNEAHASYLRNAATAGQPVGGQGVSLASQGFTTGAGTSGIVPQMPSIEGVENIIFNDFTMGTTVTGLSQAENTDSFSNDLTWTRGSHLLSFGASAHIDQINTHPNVYDNGSFLFTGSETGSDFADFLLGIDSSYTQGDGQNFYNRNHYLGLYAQDSWRATPHLTLNYGVRWDVLPPWYEKYNQLLSLDPGEQSVVYPNAPKGILFPGDPGVPRTISPTRYNNFAPRLAASWQPTLRGLREKTVVRAGYGVYYSAFEGLSAGIMSGNPPYGFTDTTAAPTRFEEPFVQAATNTSLGQPFPLQRVAFGASPSHPNTSVDWTNFEPLTGIPAFAKDNVTPTTENYTLSIERQVTSHTLARIGYVGTQAHHLLVIQEANPGNPALCLSLSQTAEVAPGSATCGPFNESSTFVSASGQVVGGTRGAVQRSLRKRKPPENNCELARQRARSTGATCEPTSLPAAFVHVEQVDRSVLKPCRGSLPRQRRPQPRPFGVRHDAQLRRDLSLRAPASAVVVLSAASSRRLAGLRAHATRYRPARNLDQQQRHLAARHSAKRHQRQRHRRAAVHLRRSATARPAGPPGLQRGAILASGTRHPGQRPQTLLLRPRNRQHGPCPVQANAGPRWPVAGAEMRGLQYLQPRAVFRSRRRER